MEQMTTPRRRMHALLATALACAAAVLLPAAVVMAQAGDATTYEDCFRSLRSCQKKRCGSAAGEEQVTCVRQCAREYDTCVGGASGGDGTGPAKHRRGTPRAAGKDAPRREVQRYKTPAGN